MGGRGSINIDVHSCSPAIDAGVGYASRVKLVLDDIEQALPLGHNNTAGRGGKGRGGEGRGGEGRE